MDNNFPLHEFDVHLHNFSAAEKAVIDTLVEASYLTAKLYLKQENHKYPGANFYPHDATKVEIEQAAAKNPAILDPYTIVERSDTGKLVAVPFHITYQKELEKIAEKLREASRLSDNKQFAKRLKFQATALLDGSYEASDIYWLTMEPYKISFVIGPIERYEDKLFFKKCGYQAILGVVNEQKTKRIHQIQRVLYDVRRSTLAPSEKADFLDKIQLRVDNTILFAGLFARGMFTSENLPNDVNLMAKYGTQIMLFDTSLDLKFYTQHFPIFHRVFEKKFARAYSTELLREGSFQNVFLHEIGHTLLRYKNAENRLRELFPVIDELSATIYGIKSCAALLLKDIMREQEIEAIMIMFICRAFTWWMDMQTQPAVEPYARGHAIALNYFFAIGALHESQGISWPNFTKMFFGIQQLSDALERLISVGSYEDAKYFIEQYGSYNVYARFAPTLLYAQRERI